MSLCLPTRSILVTVGVGAALFHSAACQAQSLATDAFVRQSLDFRNFEPGGSYFPGPRLETRTIPARTYTYQIAGRTYTYTTPARTYQVMVGGFPVRGDVIPTTRQGEIRLEVGPMVHIGGNLYQQIAPINGQYQYKIDLSHDHPHTVHSPFDMQQRQQTAVSDISPSRTVNINMQIDAAFTHPANGYDPPKGGAFPAPSPLGAHDVYDFYVTGRAEGVFVGSVPDTSSQSERAQGSVATAANPTSSGQTAERSMQVHGGGAAGGPDTGGGTAQPGAGSAHANGSAVTLDPRTSHTVSLVIYRGHQRVVIDANQPFLPGSHSGTQMGSVTPASLATSQSTSGGNNNVTPATIMNGNPGGGSVTPHSLGGNVF